MEKKSKKIRWPMIVVFLGVSAVITLLALFFYHDQVRQLQRQNKSTLITLAEFKRDQIINWRQERIADGLTIFRTPAMGFAIGRWLSSPNRDIGRAEIMGRLEASKASKSYKDVLLIDRQGNILLSTNQYLTKVCQEAFSLFLQAEAKREVFFGDFYSCSQCREIHLDIVVPLFSDKQPDSKAAAGLILRVDPKVFLHPLMQLWPTPSATAETLIVRREGQDVVFLNELRHRKNTALKLRMPITSSQLVAAMAARGEKGVVEGLDYRGQKVIASIMPIPASPWYMVTKIDAKEVFVPLRQRRLLITLFAAALIMLTGLLINRGVNVQQKRYYKKLYLLEAERQALKNHYEYLVRYANDIILLADGDGNIIEANDRALSTYGYGREELLTKNLEDLQAPQRLEKPQDIITEFSLRNDSLLEISHRRKDGTVFPVEINPNLIEVEGKRYFQAIIRDISERKQAESALLEKTAYLDQLFENLPLAAQLCDPRGKILRVNPATTAMFGYTSEEMVGRCMDDLVNLKGQLTQAQEYTMRVFKGETLLFEAVRRKKDGSLLDVFVIVFPVYIGTKQIAMYSIYQDISERKKAEDKITLNMQRLQKIMMEIIQALARVVESRDLYTSNHQKRVAKLACAIALEMRLDVNKVEGLNIASLVHDIGKISVPAEILSKPTRLSEVEFNLVKTHPRSGYEILKEVEFPWPVARIVFEHHEKMNGSGYPQGLKGNDLLLESRILAIADVVEAICSHRPYRPALGLEFALKEIEDNRETLFDQEVVDVCLRLFRERGFSFD